MLVFSLASGGAHIAVEQKPGQTQQVLRLGAKVMLLHSLDHFFSTLFVGGDTLPVLLAPVRPHVPVRWALVYLKAAPRESRVHKTQSIL